MIFKSSILFLAISNSLITIKISYRQYLHQIAKSLILLVLVLVLVVV